MCLYSLFGIKVHPPCAFPLFKDKITCGRSTFTPVSGVKAHLPFGCESASPLEPPETPKNSKKLKSD